VSHLDRDAFGDADDQPDSGIGCLQDGIAAEGGRDKDQRRVAPGLLHRVADRVEDRDAFHLLAALARGHPGHDLRPVRFALRGVKRPFSSRNPLHHHPRRLIH